MSNDKRYVLDANVFIEAKQRYYSFDVFPGFWNWLLWQHEQGRLLTIDRVKIELQALRDELSEWVANDVPASFFVPTSDASIATCFGKLVTWVQAQPQFLDEAKAEFASVADGWLIAYAVDQNVTLVTHEVLVPDIKRRVPIPNVCEAFGVPYTNTFEMFRNLGAEFGWRPPIE